MKAVICRQYGPPELLAVAETPPPEAGQGEVVVKVAACGVSFADSLLVQRKYQLRPELPFIPGGEVAGEVRSIGAGVIGFRPGDRVAGFGQLGGFAEETCLKATQLMRIPPGIGFPEAAAFPLNYATAYHALRNRAALCAGEDLLVLGASCGLGLAAIQLGKAMEARVIAAASTQQKLDLCRQHGADQVINYEKNSLRDAIRELCGDRGVDVVFDPVGGRYAEPAVRSLAWKGRYLVIGFAVGEISQVPLNLVLLKGCAILGFSVGAFIHHEPEAARINTQMLGTWWREGRLRPHIGGTYPLARAAEALADIASRRVVGKLVLLP